MYIFYKAGPEQKRENWGRVISECKTLQWSVFYYDIVQIHYLPIRFLEMEENPAHIYDWAHVGERGGLRGGSMRTWIGIWERKKERAWQLTRTSQKPKLPWKQREHLTPIHVGINMNIQSLDFRALLPLIISSFFLFSKHPFGHFYRHTIFQHTIFLAC